jgi:hypothetical protein
MIELGGIILFCIFVLFLMSFIPSLVIAIALQHGVQPKTMILLVVGFCFGVLFSLFLIGH